LFVADERLGVTTERNVELADRMPDSSPLNPVLLRKIVRAARSTGKRLFVGILNGVIVTGIVLMYP
jgi:hypothetical protein